MTERLAIVDGIRTPFCKAGGALRSMQADDLGVGPVRELLARTQIAATDIDEVIFGNVCQPAHAANIARIIALKAGLPQSCIAATVHRNCASGMESITSAWERILSGHADIIIAGGTESMSNVPLLYGPEMTAFFTRLMKAKNIFQRLSVLASFRPRHLKPIIGLQLGLTDPVCGLNMGQTAENLSRDFAITRAEQDAFALLSHQRAAAAAERLSEEILPTPLAPHYKTVCTADDNVRAEQTLEALQKLRPYFDRTNGTVTVGNACPVTDGAAALLLMSESTARERGYTPLGYLRHWTYAALDPSRMGLGPVFAAAKLFKTYGSSLQDYQLIEINEAFAAQVLACERACASQAFAQNHLGQEEALGEIGRDRLNVNGGAIALGHPVGTTGTRLVLTILHELRRRGAQRGLATLCIGGGQGAALDLEVE